MLLSDLEKKCNNPLILSNIQLHRKEPFVFYYRLITRGMVPVSLDCTWLTSENFASQVMSIKLIKCFGVAHRKPPDQAPADGCRGGGWQGRGSVWLYSFPFQCRRSLNPDSGNKVLWGMSSPSSRFASFPNEATFLVLTAHLSITGLFCSKQSELRLGNTVSVHSHKSSSDSAVRSGLLSRSVCRFYSSSLK